MKLLLRLPLLIVATFIHPVLWAQCPTDDVTLATQADIMAYAAQFPDCSQLDGNLKIGTDSTLSDIHDLSPLYKIQSITGTLRIQNNPNLKTLIGLENIERAGHLRIEKNHSLTNLQGLAGLHTVDGRFVIFNNRNLVNFLGLTNLSNLLGNFLIVNNPSLVDFSGLGTLAVVDSLIIDSNPSLRSWNGLDNLSEVGGHFYVSSNPSLESFTGLERLRIIKGELLIFENESLQTLGGLDNLDSIGQDFALVYNPALVNLRGLGKLSYIGGDALFSENQSFVSFEGAPKLRTIQGTMLLELLKITAITGLPSFLSVKGSLSIKENYQLQDLSGFGNIFSLEGNLIIFNNPRIKHLNGLESLSYLGGYLYIWGNDLLENLDALGNVESINGYIQIEQNASLQSLKGLAQITPQSIQALTIQNCPNLTECAIESICGYLALPNGKVTIQNNKSDCFDRAAVEGACMTISTRTHHASSRHLVVAPNPASEIATLQFTGQYPPALTHIQVLDATGRLCWTGQMEGGVPVSLDLGAFPPGVYGVVFRGDWGSGVKRLVKR